MQSLRFLPLVLALGLVSSCNKSEVDAAPGDGTTISGDAAKTAGDATKAAGDAMKNAGEAAKGAMQQAGAALDGFMKDLDTKNLATLDTAKLQELGKNAMAAVATQLGNIKDLASAKNVSSAVTPMVEKLENLKKALGGTLPNVESVKSAISSLTAKFQSGEIMEAIQPMITKLQSLIGA